MSSQAPSSQPKSASSRGNGRRGGNRGRSGRGSGFRGGRGGKTSEAVGNAENKDGEKELNPVTSIVPMTAEGDPDDEEVCWICAEPIKYYSVSQCNHRTCHVCALRLRALYKKLDCTFCKEPQAKVIFTTSSDAPYDSYTPESTPFNDPKLFTYFESREMMEETLILLRFNCPDPECDYIGNGWADLKLHIRASHGKLLCDLCLRFKKVFSHEHALYPPAILAMHLPSTHQRTSKKDILPPEQIEGGVHPLCEFCKECFFSSDELFAHMRERHEECFICKRNEIRDQYFNNYESLEKHFESAHYPCQNQECQARKFVVFNTPLDLQGHMVEQHGADMSSRDRKNAQRVQADFTFEEPGRRDSRLRNEPTRQQPQQPQTPTPFGPPPGPARGTNSRRATFGGQLTNDTVASNQNQSHASPAISRPASPPDRKVDPATTERHTSFLTRLESLALNPANAVSAVKAASRSYKTSESSAKDFILTVWNVLDSHLDHTATIINHFVDLLDEEDKKQDLLTSWRTFAIERRREFPDLVPSAVGGDYASITSGRVLKAKKSARASHHTTHQVWDRVARAAGSSSVPGSLPRIERFPALGAPASSSSSAVPTPTPLGQTYRPSGTQRTTPWSAAASGSSGRAQSKPSSKKVAKVPTRPPPSLSKSAFPELPTVTTPRAKPQVSGNVSLKNILGTPAAPLAPAWGNGDEEATGGPMGEAPPEETEEADNGAGKGKGKKKGKGKQTLFTLGSFPA